MFSQYMGKNDDQWVSCIFTFAYAIFESVWEKIIYGTRHTFYPVCESTPDDVIGIQNAKDYFRLDDKTRESVMKEAVTSAYFVPDIRRCGWHCYAERSDRTVGWKHV